MEWQPWTKVEERALARYVTASAVNFVRLPDGVERMRLEPEELVEHIYNVLLQKNIRYALEKFDENDELQAIRSPAEVLTNPGEGTCLDLALLFCGVCLGFDLLPLLVMVKGHAFAAVSVTHGRRKYRAQSRDERANFTYGYLADGELLRDLLDSGAYIAVECTGFATSTVLAPTMPEGKCRVGGVLTWQRALEAGREQLDVLDRPFKFALDIAALQMGYHLSPYAVHLIDDRPLPPLESFQAPLLDSFVGRQTELANYQGELDNQGAAVICGSAGVGKTALAIELANRNGSPTHTFWHSFHAGSGFDQFVARLGDFLARHGKPSLRQILTRNNQTSALARPSDLPISDYIVADLCGKGFVLCCDDIHFVQDDPLFREQIKLLIGKAKARQIKIIITSQRAWDLSHDLRLTPLGGFALADLQVFFTERGFNLSSALVDAVYAKTAGYAQFVTILAAALPKDSADAAAFVNTLVPGDDTRYFPLLKRIDLVLNSEERSVLQAVAALWSEQASRSAIAVVVAAGSNGSADSSNLYVTLQELNSKFLLSSQVNGGTRYYSLHTVVQDFYYRMLDSDRGQRMHRAAAGYFLQHEQDLLLTVRHYQAADDTTTVADLLTGNLWHLIHRGYVRTVRELLHSLPRQEGLLRYARLHLALGQVLGIIGDTGAARHSFEQVLAATSDFGTQPDIAELRSLAYERMAWLLERESLHVALRWIKRGQEEWLRAGLSADAALLIRQGIIQSALGQNRAAEKTLKQGLSSVSSMPSQLLGNALLNLGNVYSERGKLETGDDYYRQALAVAELLGDDFLRLATSSNLAINCEVAGDWHHAVVGYHAALDLAQRLGDVGECARIDNSLATLYTKQGNHDQAVAHATRAIDSARLYRDREVLLYALTTLAEAYIHNANPHVESPPGQTALLGVVVRILDEADALANELDIPFITAELENLRALLILQGQKSAQALSAASVHAEHAIALARQQKSPEVGRFLRTLSKIRAAAGETLAAIELLQTALVLLDGRNPYEAACVRLVWALLSLQSGTNLDEATRDQAYGHLCQAHATFATLGATRELAAIASVHSCSD